MKKIIRLTESDLTKLIRRVIKENEFDYDKWEKSLSDRNTKLFSKMNAPQHITIEITEDGKRFLKTLFKKVLGQSRPDRYKEPNVPKGMGNWIPSFFDRIDDKITLERKIYPTFSRGDSVGRFRIAQFQIDQLAYYENKWSTLSPSFKYSNGKSSSDLYEMYAFYLPLEDKDGKGGKIQIVGGVEPVNTSELDYDEFDKIEVGEVSNNGYFKIVEIPEKKDDSISERYYRRKRY